MSKRKKRKSTPKTVHTPGTNERLAAKKAAVLGNDKKNGLPPLVAAIVAVVLASVGGYYYYSNSAKGQPGAVPAVVQAATSDRPSEYSYPLELFEDGVARHFAHTNGQNTIRYFVLKSSDGIVRAAFDACDVCWPAGKGYVQDGDVMICRNCGRRFDSVRINEVKGGCNPAPLNRQVIDGKLVVKIDDILTGERYFDFSRRRDS